jgi:hypothetical protein
MKMRRFCALLMAWTLLGYTSHLHAGVIQNGEFTSGLAHWTTVSGFDAPTDGGEVALFSESSFGVQLEQAFVLPTNALKLSFEYHLKASGSPVVGAVPDNFQATLFTSSGTLFPSDPSDPVSFPAFYSVDNSGPSPEAFDSLFVSVETLLNGNRKVTVDLASALATFGNQSLIIDFLLSGNPDGFTTNVTLDNVVITLQNVSAVPEPGSALAWFALIGTVSLVRRRRV